MYTICWNTQTMCSRMKITTTQRVSQKKVGAKTHLYKFYLLIFLIAVADDKTIRFLSLGLVCTIRITHDECDKQTLIPEVAEVAGLSGSLTSPQQTMLLTAQWTAFWISLLSVVLFARARHGKVRIDCQAKLLFAHLYVRKHLHAARLFTNSIFFK